MQPGRSDRVEPSARGGGLGRPVRAAVYGASGYVGAELLRLLAGHPSFEVELATADSSAGRPVGSVYPSLRAAYPDLVLSPNEARAAKGMDLAFCALPHGSSAQLVPQLLDEVPHVVDLSADFRLKDPSAYPRWYGGEHPRPELLERAVLGIPELYRSSMRSAQLVAAAGCYVTAACLALAPLLRAGLVAPDPVIVDAASGVSGSGRVPKDSTHFNSVDEDFSAYGLISHRHTPEMEQVLGARVLFTPHLAPMNRGILATCYARPQVGADSVDPLEALRQFYRDEPFVEVLDQPPSTKATLGSNCAHLSARHDPRTGWVLALCALDNLTKGAAGQALQCANLVLGLPEEAGLPKAGLYP